MPSIQSIPQPPGPARTGGTYAEPTTLAANHFYAKIAPTEAALEFLRNRNSPSLRSHAGRAADVHRAEKRPRIAPSNSVQDIDREFEIEQPFHGEADQ